MGSTVQVGRVSVSLEVAVEAAVYRGDALRLSCYCDGTATHMYAIIEGLCAYAASTDESVVPVTFDTPLAHLTGFYRVGDVSVDQAMPDRSDLTLDLERVQGYTAPLFESIVLGGKRSGVAAGVTAEAWQALPAAVMGYENGVITPTVETVATADGNLTLFTDAVNKLFNARVEFYLPPASWYVGAATLTVGGNLIVGRQCQNDPDGWVISNGIIRLSGVANAGAIKLEHWSGAAWVGDGSYWFGQYGGGAQPLLTAAPLAITVLRNDPACVTIRLAYDAASIVTNARFAVNVDVSLRRGATSAEVYLSTRGAYRWLVKTPIVYATAVGGGGAKADPANGAAIAYGNMEAIEPADPKVYALTANGTYVACGIGHVFGTVNASTVGTFGSRYAAAQAERVLAVAR